MHAWEESYERSGKSILTSVQKEMAKSRVAKSTRKDM
jgi:hypothetical protein